MRRPLRSSALLPILLAAAPLTESAAQSTASAKSSAVGDTASFGLRIVAVVGGPDRITYRLPRPAYVTMISVTDSTIEPLMPLVSEEPRIVMAGEHTTGLNRGRESMP